MFTINYCEKMKYKVIWHDCEDEDETLIWKKLFIRHYDEVEYIGSPGYLQILNEPAYISRDEGNVRLVTYFYNFSGIEDEFRRYCEAYLNLKEFEAGSSVKEDIFAHVDHRAIHAIRTKLEQLTKEGKTITHIVKSTERYYESPDYDDSHGAAGYRKIRAEIYEFVKL